MLGAPDFLLVLNILSGVFMASAIEAIETYTQLVCVARCISKKAALTGFLLALGVLVALTATLGMTIIYLVPIQLFHFIFGVFALLVGLRWLRDGVLRYSGWMEKRDEAVQYEQNQAHLTTTSPKLPVGQFWFGVIATFKPTFIEGLETAYLVLVLGYPYHLVGEAAGTALAAYILVGLVALALFSGPLRAVPINLLKGLVGLQMVTLGTLWTGTALGVMWWRENLSYFLVLTVYIVATLVLTRLLTNSHKKYLEWQAVQNGKLARYSWCGIKGLVTTNSVQLNLARPNPNRIMNGLATLNRLFFGDKIILTGLPVVICLTWLVSGSLVVTDSLILIFPALGLFLIGGLVAVLALANTQYIAHQKGRETDLLHTNSPALARNTEVEAAQ